MSSQLPVFTPEGSEVIIRVLVDGWRNEEFNMEYLIEQLAEAYQREYANVVLEIECLPNESEQQEERDLRIQQIRAEIQAGDGPDIFLISAQVRYSYFEPLFKDVEAAVWNRVFRDLSGYYDADDELGKDGLNQTVMDAGVFGEARYILPLYYDMSVLQINNEKISACGLGAEELTGSWVTLVEQILETEDPLMAQGVAFNDLNYLDCFGELIDYENGQLLLTQEQVARAMELSQQIKYLSSQPVEADAYTGEASVVAYVAHGDFWLSDGAPMMVERLQPALYTAVLAKALGLEYEMYPIAADDGTAVASVTYWGAVGANCKAPDVAYDFLRRFLSEEAQWETTRSATSAGLGQRLYADGIPVRTKGMVKALLPSIINQASQQSGREGAKERNQLLEEVVVDDSDFPILNAQIDEVRFGNMYYARFHTVLRSLNDSMNGNIPTDVDIGEAAADFLRDIEFFLAES